MQVQRTWRVASFAVVMGGAIAGAFALPAAAQNSGGRLENCRFGESCWGGALEKASERMQQQMRDAQSAASRQSAAAAQSRRMAAAQVSAPVRAGGTVEIDMRLFSFGDCAKRYERSDPMYQECTRIVASDEARQAKLDRSCAENYPNEPQEYERCRTPQRPADPASVAAFSAPAGPNIVVVGASVAATPQPVVTPAATQPPPPSPAQAGDPPPPPEPPAPPPTVSWFGIGLCIFGVVAGIIGINRQYRQLSAGDVVVTSTLGVMSAWLVYVIASLLTHKSSLLPHDTFVFVTFNVSWTLSVWVMLQGATSTMKVAARGLLIGTAEWILLLLAAMAFSEIALPAAGAGAKPAAAAGLLGLPIFGVVNGMIAMIAAAACLASFAVLMLVMRKTPTQVTSSPPTRMPAMELRSGD